MATQLTEAPTDYKRLNPAELEIDLFCKGVRIHSTCDLGNDARDFIRTRAGLGSGLETIIPGKRDIWMNVPVEERFSESSPYTLLKTNGSYRILHEPSSISYDVKLPATPSWYAKKTSSGLSMKEVGVLQGTYLGVYVGPRCAYWNCTPQENCRFCTTGINVGTVDKSEKTVDEVVETALAAKEESGITFVHFNTGFHKQDGLDICAPFVKAVKEKVGALVGVQAIPSADLWKYDWLMDCGCDHVSFCFELYNPDYFAKFLPGKHKHITQQRFFKALEYTSKKLGKGRVSGEIIAGIEPLEDTLNAIDYITRVGAFPTVCIFRPLIGSQLEETPSPTYEEMRVVFQHVYDCCEKYGIPIGLAPNIEVSLVVQPTDTLYLAKPGLGSFLYKSKLGLAKMLVKPLFKKRVSPMTIQADADNPPASPPGTN